MAHGMGSRKVISASLVVAITLVAAQQSVPIGVPAPVAQPASSFVASPAASPTSASCIPGLFQSDFGNFESFAAEISITGEPKPDEGKVPAAKIVTRIGFINCTPPTRLLFDSYIWLDGDLKGRVSFPSHRLDFVPTDSAISALCSLNASADEVLCATWLPSGTFDNAFHTELRRLRLVAGDQPWTKESLRQNLHVELDGSATAMADGLVVADMVEHRASESLYCLVHDLAAKRIAVHRLAMKGNDISLPPSFSAELRNAVDVTNSFPVARAIRSMVLKPQAVARDSKTPGVKDSLAGPAVVLFDCPTWSQGFPNEVFVLHIDSAGGIALANSKRFDANEFMRIYELIDN